MESVNYRFSARRPTRLFPPTQVVRILTSRILDRIDGKDVVTEQNHVGQLAGRDRALFFFLKFRVGGAHGVGLDGFRNREFLLGKPAVGILAVQASRG